MNKISWDEDNINYLPTISVTATDAIPTTIGVNSPIQVHGTTTDMKPYFWFSDAIYPETGETAY
jgi:hypothetical protein